MRCLVAVALFALPVHCHGRQLYDAQLKFDIDAACIGVDPAEADSECRSLCQTGECCFVYEQDCTSNVDCEVYESCDPVFEDPMVGEAGFGKMDPDTYDADDIEVACTTMDPPPPPGHPSLCKLMCEPGKCCFDHKGCDKSTHDSMQHCLKYEACWVLYEEGTVDDDEVVEEDAREEEEESNRHLKEKDMMDPSTYDSKDIEVACNEEELQSGSLCHLMCEPGRCCFEHTDCDESIHDKMEHCLKYTPCWILHADGTVDDDVVIDEEDNDRHLKDDMMDPSTYTAEDIEVACEEMNPKAGSLCHLMCEPGRCCFEHKDCDESTHDAMKHCLKYTACWILHTDGTVDDDIVPQTEEMPGAPEDEDGDRRRGLLRSLL